MYSKEEISLIERSESLARRLDKCFKYYNEYNIVCDEVYDIIVNLSVLKNELHNPISKGEKEVSTYISTI